MVLRVIFNKKNYMRYISHLDLMRLFQRSFNRADIPVKYSEGFNPQPKFSIAAPLSLGIESEEEYMDIELEYVPINEFIDRMNKVLPKDVQIVKAKYLDKSESINSIIEWADYEFNFDIENMETIEKLDEMVSSWLKSHEIIVTKISKKKGKEDKKEVDIKPFIKYVEVKKNGENIILKARIKTGSNGNLNPVDFIHALDKGCNLNIDIDSLRIKRIGLYGEKNGKLYKPL